MKMLQDKYKNLLWQRSGNPSFIKTKIDWKTTSYVTSYITNNEYIGDPNHRTWVLKLEKNVLENSSINVIRTLNTIHRFQTSNTNSRVDDLVVEAIEHNDN